MICEEKKIECGGDKDNGSNIYENECKVDEHIEGEDGSVGGNAEANRLGNADSGVEEVPDNPYQRMVRSLANRSSSKRKVKLMETSLVQFAFDESDSEDDEDYVVCEEDMKKVMNEDDESDDNDLSEDAINSSDEEEQTYSLGDMLKSYESGSRRKNRGMRDSSDEELGDDTDGKTNDEQDSQQDNGSDAEQYTVMESDQESSQETLEEMESDRCEKVSSRRFLIRDKKPVSVCGICLESDENDGDEIVECDNCGITVHEGCYGDYSLDDDNKSDTDDLMEPWFCEPCKADAADLVCELCPTKGGIFKQTDTGKWTHLICALYTPYVGFRDVVKLQVVVLEDIKVHLWSNKECLFCAEETFSRTGVCIGCDAGLCKTIFHVTCGQRHGFLSEIPDRSEGNVETTDFLFAHCKLHTTRNVLKKRKSSWLAYQARVSKFKPSNDPAEKQRIRNALYLARRKYKEFRRTLIPARQLPQEFPRLLSSCPLACMMLARKAELLDMVKEAGFNVTAAITSGRISKGEVNLSEDFVNYFFKREIQLKEMQQTQMFAEPNIVKLQNEQKILTNKIEVYFTKLEKIQQRKNSLINCCQSFHDVLCKLAGKSLKLPQILKADKKDEISEKIEKSTELLNSIINKCVTCKSTDDQHLLAQCGTCSKYYHMNCVNPPLTRMPKESDKFVWQCTSCDPSDKSGSDSESVKGLSEGSGMVRRKRPNKEPEKYNPEPPKEKKGKDSNEVSKRQKEKCNTELHEKSKEKIVDKLKSKKDRFKEDGQKENKIKFDFNAQKKIKKYHFDIQKTKKEVFNSSQVRKDLKKKKIIPNSNSLKENKEKVENKEQRINEDNFLRKKKILKKSEYESDPFEFKEILKDEKVKDKAFGEKKEMKKENELGKEIEKGSAKRIKKSTKVTLSDCFVCKKFLDEKLLVKCDECSRCYHFLTCINPPYPRNPKVNKYWAWFCEECDNTEQDVRDQVVLDKRASNKQARLSIKSSFGKKVTGKEYTVEDEIVADKKNMENGVMKRTVGNEVNTMNQEELPGNEVKASQGTGSGAVCTRSSKVQPKNDLKEVTVRRLFTDGKKETFKHMLGDGKKESSGSGLSHGDGHQPCNQLNVSVPKLGSKRSCVEEETKSWPAVNCKTELNNRKLDDKACLSKELIIDNNEVVSQLDVESKVTKRVDGGIQGGQLRFSTRNLKEINRIVSDDKCMNDVINQLSSNDTETPSEEIDAENMKEANMRLVSDCPNNSGELPLVDNSGEVHKRLPNDVTEEEIAQNPNSSEEVEKRLPNNVTEENAQNLDSSEEVNKRLPNDLARERNIYNPDSCLEQGSNLLFDGDMVEKNKPITNSGMKEQNDQLECSNKKEIDNKSHPKDKKELNTSSLITDKKESNKCLSIDDENESSLLSVNDNKDASIFLKTDLQKGANRSFGQTERSKANFEGKKEDDRRYHTERQKEGSSRYRTDDQKEASENFNFDEQRNSRKRKHHFSNKKEANKFYNYDRNEGNKRYRTDDYNDSNNRYHFENYNERNNRFRFDERNIGSSRYHPEDSSFGPRPPFYRNSSRPPAWVPGNMRNREKTNYANNKGRGRKFIP